jgi:hypothetical protein
MRPAPWERARLARILVGFHDFCGRDARVPRLFSEQIVVGMRHEVIGASRFLMNKLKRFHNELLKQRPLSWGFDHGAGFDVSCQLLRGPPG